MQLVVLTNDQDEVKNGIKEYIKQYVSEDTHGLHCRVGWLENFNYIALAEECESLCKRIEALEEQLKAKEGK